MLFRKLRGSLLLPAVFTLAACFGDGSRISGTTAFAGGNTGGNNGVGPVAPLIDSRLVATWSRTLFFSDANGLSSSNQLIWEFEADGTARRTTISVDYVLGFSATESLAATWTARDGFVDVSFVPASNGSVRYSYSVAGNRLLLGATELERLF